MFSTLLSARCSVPCSSLTGIGDRDEDFIVGNGFRRSMQRLVSMASLTRGLQTVWLSAPTLRLIAKFSPTSLQTSHTPSRALLTKLDCNQEWLSLSTGNPSCSRWLVSALIRLLRKASCRWSNADLTKCRQWLRSQSRWCGVWDSPRGTRRRMPTTWGSVTSRRMPSSSKSSNGWIWRIRSRKGCQEKSLPTIGRKTCQCTTTSASHELELSKPYLKTNST